MAERPSKARVAVFAALGVVLLLLGIDAVRGAGDGKAGQGEQIAAGPVVRADGGGGGGGSGELVVHVAGEVDDPGVYSLSAGSRVTDAIKRAGGPTGAAAVDGINLAARLADGQQVVVPSTKAVTSGAGAGEGPISLGSAGAADLEGIDGIGPVTAEKIIEFRDQSGGVGSIQDLDQIPGIGPATIASLSDSLQP